MEFVPVINSERIPALQQNRIDLAASGMTRADNRRHLIGFSLAYLVSRTPSSSARTQASKL